MVHRNHDAPTDGTRATGPGAVASGAEHYLATELFERMHSTRQLVAFLEAGSLDGMWIWDLEDRDNVWMTQRFRELLGFGDLDPDVGAAAMNDRIHPADAQMATEAFERHLADPAAPYDVVVRYRHRDGSAVWVRSRGFALREPDGRPTRFVGVHTDLTATMQVRTELEESLGSLEAYSSMLEQVDRVTASLQELTEPAQVPASLARILGSDVGEMALVVQPVDGELQLTAAHATDPFRAEGVQRMLAGAAPGPQDGGPMGTVLRTGEPLVWAQVDGPDLLQHVRDDARSEIAAYLPTSVICVPWARSGDQWGAVLVLRFDPGLGGFLERDLTLVRQVVERHGSALRQLQTQLETRAVSRFRELARSAPMAIVQIDAAGACTFVNDQWTALTGRGPEHSMGGAWVQVFDPADLEELRAAWSPALASGDVLRVETRIRHTDGRTLWVGGSAVAQFDDAGAYSGALIALSDITTRKRAEVELTRRARIDPLTRVDNRYALFEHVDAALAGVRTDDAVVGLLYLDLDTFKEVNDSLGHEVGDQLLVAVAERISGVLRADDSCARVGGDEFVVLLDRLVDHRAAARVAERVREVLRAPFEVSGVTIHTSASMGVVTVGRDDGVLRADEVLRRADRAMYRAKEAGRDRWETFDPAMDEDARSEATLRREIDDAIGGDHLVLHYQPIVTLDDGTLVGVEALVRIQHPSRGLLPPAEFLDVAERSGQIVEIGRWVIDEACRQLSRWHEVQPDLYLSLNLSGRQIADGGVADLVLDAVARHRIRPDRLVVEVTETTLVRAIGSAAAAVERMRAAGVRVAIDDFGTGYSTLARLTEIPADMIKVDRSFVSTAPQDPMRAAIISAVVHLTGLVHLEVVAEGIETEEQRRTIMELGCRVGQGYLFSRPVAAPDLEALVGVLL